MKNLEQIKEIIRIHRKELEDKYKVKNIAIFGSFARNEQNTQSDIDIMVEFTEPVGFLFFHLADYLEEITEVKVDLVTNDGIKPNRRPYIMKEIVYV